MTTTILIILGAVVLLSGLLVPVRRRNRRIRLLRHRQARILILAEGIAEEHSVGEDAAAQASTLRDWAPHMDTDDWEFFEATYRKRYEDLTARLTTGNAEMERLEQTFRRNQETSRARLEIIGDYRPEHQQTEQSSEGRDEEEPAGDPKLAEFQALMDSHITFAQQRGHSAS